MLLPSPKPRTRPGPTFPLSKSAPALPGPVSSSLGMPLPSLYCPKPSPRLLELSQSPGSPGSLPCGHHSTQSCCDQWPWTFGLEAQAPSPARLAALPITDHHVAQTSSVNPEYRGADQAHTTDRATEHFVLPTSVLLLPLISHQHLTVGRLPIESQIAGFTQQSYRSGSVGLCPSWPHSAGPGSRGPLGTTVLSACRPTCQPCATLWHSGPSSAI